MRFSQFLMEQNIKHHKDEESIQWLLYGVKQCERHLHLIATGKQLPAWRGADEMKTGVIELPSGLALNYSVEFARTKLRTSLAQNDVGLAYATREWKNLPRRGYSYFATFSRDFAESTFGDLYWIIPLDNVTKFASAKQDFNIFDDETSKRDAYEVLQALDKIAEQLRDSPAEGANAGPVFTYIGNLAQPFADSFHPFTEGSHSLKAALNDPAKQAQALEFFQKLMNDIPKIVKIGNSLTLPKDTAGDKKLRPPHDRWTINRNIIISEQLDELYDKLRALGALNLIQYLKEHMSPEALGIELVNGYENLPAHKNTDSEFWFEGDFIAFDAFYPNFIEESVAKEMAGQLLQLLEKDKK